MFSEDFTNATTNWQSTWTKYDEDIDGGTHEFLQNGDKMSSYSVWNSAQLSPNNYAVTLEIPLNGATGLRLTYKVYGGWPGQSAEVYTVYVSTGNTVNDFLGMTGATTWSFNENLGDDPTAANGEIVSRMHDFSDLDGATDVYIAFRHHDTPDGQWFISFDDVVLDTTLGIEDNTFAGFKLFVDTQHVLQLLSTNKTLDGIAIFNLYRTTHFI